MANVVVVGSQWGDEGKGKIVDWLSERASVVVRFQGGHNAGHTLVVNGETFKLSSLPSGVVRNGKLSIIGSGVVVDPWALLDEIKRLRSQGLSINQENLKIADNACLILPVHRDLDGIREDASLERKIGTTRRGIGPAYEDKVGRRAIRVCDLRHFEQLPAKVSHLLEHHNALRRGLGHEEVDGLELTQILINLAPAILPYASRIWNDLNAAKKAGLRILFEGAQGAMLDVDHGTYPYVTSSNTVAGQASAGAGIGLNGMDYVLGITKSYTTRVGEGPFPTELQNDIGVGLGERGKEFGTVTSRARRCGWFDAVMVRQAIQIGGITGLALTKLDVLDGMNEIKICVGYKLDGNSIDYFPADVEDQKSVIPIYETFQGWSKSTRGARSWADLPATAVKYVVRIEELVGCAVAMLSTSPEREDTILVTDPFSD